MSSIPHPLSALSAAEITLAARIVRTDYDAGTKLRFKAITLHEPSRKEVQQYRSSTSSGSYCPDRKAWVNYYLTGTASFFELIVNLSTESIERKSQVPAEFHGPVDDAEIVLVEKIALEDPRTKAEIEKLKLPEGAVVVCDPWIW
jgi:primary-amine oxidase